MVSTREKGKLLDSIGMSRKEIANLCGVSRQRVHQILGKYSPGNFIPFNSSRCCYINLRNWLNTNKISVSELCRRLYKNWYGNSRSNVEGWLKGKNFPTKKNIDKLISITGLTYEQLFEVG